MLAPLLHNSPLVEGRKAVVYAEGHHKTKEAYKEALLRHRNEVNRQKEQQ